LWNVQEFMGTLVRRFVRYEAVFKEAILVVPILAAKARAKMHGVWIIGAVGFPTGASDA
jgi:hypothetical protein